MANFRLAGFQEESIVDGPGLRTVVFFQGCPHHCPGCHNPETWDKKGGYTRSLEEVMDTIHSNPLVKAVTFSGGEPFSQLCALAELAERLKAEGYNIWCYTGYSWEVVERWFRDGRDNDGIRQLLRNIDVLVDGNYRQEERTLDLPFRGSRNQRCIDVLSSLTYGRPIEWIGQE